jgi:transcriptional antiterminator RfaH
VGRISADDDCGTLDSARRVLVVSASHPPEQSETGAQASQLPWYCVRTRSGQEVSADGEIWALGFRSYLPLKEFQWRPRPMAKLTTRLEPLFPCYLFVQLDLDAPRWPIIRTVYGFVDWVRMPGKERPSRLPAGLVEHLIASGPAPLPSPAASLPPGAPVRVLKGPLADLAALVHLSSEQRVICLMSVFGRETRVELARSDVAVIS